MSERSEVKSRSSAASPAPPSLDEIFRRSVVRQPHVPALIDPPDKRRITGEAPIALTYIEVDRAVAALAGQFVAAGLPVGSVIAVQLPNTVEFYLTVLAAMRAGLIVALLPQLWRQADLSAALNRTSARAIVTAATIDGVNHADLAMNAAVEAFSIRCVFGFGGDLPEGMAPLDIYSAQDRSTPLPLPDARRPAVITFDVTPEGPRAIPRSHLHLTSGGIAIYLEAGVSQGGMLLSAMQPSSFAGLSSSLVTWLLSGGTLALHHPFDADLICRQLFEEACSTLIAPAPLAMRLSESGALADLPALRQVIGLWRAPEQVLSSAEWNHEAATLTDVYLFGEIGLFGARRAADGLPATIQPGPFGAPREVADATIAGETIVTPRGTLALRGPMVPIAAYRPAAEAADARLAPQADHVDTGYAARRERASGALCVTAPPTGVMAVGGYRFLANELQEWAKRLAQGAMLTALPDRMSGHRLAGRASDNARAREALVALGLNPLMVEAFRDRSS